MQVEPLFNIIRKVGVVCYCTDTQVLVVKKISRLRGIVKLQVCTVTIRPDVVKRTVVYDRELTRGKYADCEIAGGNGPACASKGDNLLIGERAELIRPSRVFIGYERARAAGIRKPSVDIEPMGVSE